MLHTHGFETMRTRKRPVKFAACLPGQAISSRNGKLTIKKPEAYSGLTTAYQLYRWRREHGYSQGQLAKALGVIPGTVSRWERQTRKIPALLTFCLGYLDARGKIE